MDRDWSGDRAGGPASSDFVLRLQARLRDADEQRRRRARLRRWRWRVFAVFPVAGAVCWAVLPWTFADGVRAMIGFMTYFTLLLSVGHQADSSFMTYLGIGYVPALVDALLFIGVVSWLVWASRPQDSRSGRQEPGI
ncbi:MAG TPA: hypothetical protein VFB34_13610 [Chloroflexota bacterium]|nr:hypothetical protein [Chloroflexota bacterium]